MRFLAAIGLALACGACGGDDGGATRPLVFGGPRPVELQLPADFDAARTYPLLIILHGYSVNGFIQQSYFRLFDAATTYQMLVLAPEGTTDSGGKQFWNADPVCCDFDNTGVDDVAYLGGLIDDVLAAWPVEQVYVVGHSNGGFMGYRMACERADVITASALLAGNTSRSIADCAPSQPTSMLVMHGDADAAVPYDGMATGSLSSAGAVESARRWRGYDTCSGSEPGTAMELEKSTPGDNETLVETATGCPAGLGVELWTHQGAGHLPAYNTTFGPTLWTWLTDHARP